MVWNTWKYTSLHWKDYSLQVWAAYQESDLAGFVSLSYSSEDCAEIDCLAVKKFYHKAGIGGQLPKVLEKSARQKASICR